MYSIQEVVSVTGVTSRTLRHYDTIGLLPARRGANGYRTYGQADLVRLQRILLLRDLGFGLPEIARVLAGQTDDATALRDHLRSLQSQQERISQQMRSVERTLEAIQKEEVMSTDDMFDGFDHTQYKQEVEQRWGTAAYADSDRWWRGLSDSDKQGFLVESRAIAAAWQHLRDAGVVADDPRAQEVAARHVRWIQQGWAGRQPSAEAISGIAQMYVTDQRFAANYGGTEGAQYVRDALVLFARSM
ncbi:MAG: MerR family transcriptional regulator [Actinobacteria bacterium]|nr:MerR family transcriptional regulator [Actinomycetota bacterium]MCB8997425.1 MerR family transcriptional regulator [Actinomycetota bacterium]MCB9414213.1 MerR family transcriptional regulator [Actinomycetota bacterium]HRY09534.1 MerR family transcriptional regulator [Candidatus Nanopelagicales bacterium]